MVAGWWPLSPCQQDLGPPEGHKAPPAERQFQHPQGSFPLKQLHGDTPHIHSEINSVYLRYILSSWELRDVVHRSPASPPTEALAR